MIIHADRFACGPLHIEVNAHDAGVLERIAETLRLYDVRWSGDLLSLQIEVRQCDSESFLGAGSYLTCARMHVDTADDKSLVATFRSGSTATKNGRTWHVQIPSHADDFWTLIDLESLLSLVLTEGWRECGWVPVHAGTIVRGGHCALLCAESGQGKTSLTAAMIRNGWKTLGDDKLLLRLHGGEPELRALVHTFNLHPKTRSWFPEVGDLEKLPIYSAWTEKRKVRPNDVWAGSTVESAKPTHLVQLTRSDIDGDLQLEPMTSADILSALLRQTVVPTNPGIARAIVGTIAATARSLRGLKVRAGNDVYLRPDALGPLESALL